MRLPNEEYRTVMNGRVVLAPATPANAQVMLEAMEPTRTGNLAFFTHPVTLTRQRDYLREMERSDRDCLVLVSLVDGSVPIGSAGLHEIDLSNKNARMGMLIFRGNDRGKGYGSEAIGALHRIAFDGFHLHKLYARLLVENEKAKKKYAARGYREEGVLREEYLLDGIWHDMVEMSILACEWRERHP